VDASDPTATIGGVDSRPRKICYGSPLESVGLSRSSISVTRGENSIPTKNAVAIQIATLINLTTAPVSRA
jgi:hypothetical protein